MVAQKSNSQTFAHIFTEYWPFFKTFSLGHSVENL